MSLDQTRLIERLQEQLQAAEAQIEAVRGVMLQRWHAPLSGDALCSSAVLGMAEIAALFPAPDFGDADDLDALTPATSPGAGEGTL